MRNAIERIASLKMEIESLEDARLYATTQEVRDLIDRKIQDKMSILDCLEEYCS